MNACLHADSEFQNQHQAEPHFDLGLTMWQQNTNKTWGCLDLLDVDHHLCVSDSRPHGHT